MTKKVIDVAAVALVLVAVLAFFAFNSFGGKGDETQPSDTTGASVPGGDTPGSDTVEQDDIPDDTNFNQANVTFLIWGDHTMTEFYAEGLTGNEINDAIYERNARVEERLGVKLIYREQPGKESAMAEFVKFAETDIASGACEYDMYGGYSRAVASMALTGRLVELTGLDYLNFEKPWWPEALVNECMINNKLFFCSGDISTNMLWMMVGTFFNKELLEARSLESPYDLVHKNEWTFDKMIALCSDTYDDLDGGGTKDVADFFGYTIFNANYDALFTAAGFSSLERGSDNKLKISSGLTDQKIFDLLDKLGEFTATNDLCNSSSTSIREVFFGERSIMTTDRVFIVAGKDKGSNNAKIEFEYGLVPNPKYDARQESYATNLGHEYTMYAVSVGSKQTNVCAATLECLASESYRRVTPMVFESAMKIKYASDPTTTEMYDILRSTIRFDLGRLYPKQVEDVYMLMRTLVRNNDKTFASQYKGLQKVMDKGIQTIQAAFDD